MSKSPQNCMSDSECPAWSQFLSQHVFAKGQKNGQKYQKQWPKFPKAALMQWLHRSSCPKLKQLLIILPKMLNQFETSYFCFRQLILLLYLLIVKGCVMTNLSVLEANLSVLSELLKYRIVPVCSITEKGNLCQVWDYMDNWISVLVPAILGLGNSKAKQKGKKKTLIGVIYEINKFSTKNLLSKNQNDQILILFQSLLIHKIRKSLSHSSLFQFDSIIRKIYCQQKFKLIYQGRGCVSHIYNKERQIRQKQRQFFQNNKIFISKIMHFQADDSCELYDLQLSQVPLAQSASASTTLKFNKVPAEKPMPQWVIDAYKQNFTPSSIRLTLNAILTKMKIMHVYHFLCQLENFGNSPNIQNFNQYFDDEKVIWFFEKFLMKQSLVLSAKQLIFFQMEGDRLTYSFCHKGKLFQDLMQKFMREIYKIDKSSKQIFLLEFEKRIIERFAENQIIKNE